MYVVIKFDALGTFVRDIFCYHSSTYPRVQMNV